MEGEIEYREVPILDTGCYAIKMRPTYLIEFRQFLGGRWTDWKFYSHTR